MGLLNLLCLTTDQQATVFYGFAYANAYPLPGFTSGKPNHVLAKSNVNPTSPSDITWTLVSYIDSANMATSQKFYNDYSCAVSDQGVFMLFDRVKGRNSNDNTTRPFGFRYEPNGVMGNDYNFKGPGAWRNLTIDAAYNWTEAFTKQSLGYVTSGASTILVHSLLSESGDKIYVASLNEGTKTLTAAGAWALNLTTHGKVKGMCIGNNHLYTFGLGPHLFPANWPPSYLTAFPLTSTSQTTPVAKSLDATQISDGNYCEAAYLYHNHNTLTFVCGRLAGSKLPSALYNIKDPDKALSSGPPTNFTLSVNYMDFFVPIGEGGSGASSFALMKQYGFMYAFGNENGSRYVRQINKFNITDSLGDKDDLPPSLTGSGNGATASPTASPTAAIVGSVAGVFVLGVIAFLFIKRRENKKSKDALATGAYKSQQVGQPDDSASFNPDGHYSATATYPKGQTAATTILPMAPITPVPPLAQTPPPPQQLQQQQRPKHHHQTMQEQVHALQMQVQALQHQLQASQVSQFSTHPRPNIVATAYGGEPTSSNAAGTAFAPWQPAPFFPPARSTNNTDATSSSARSSPAADIAYSNTTAPSSLNPQAIISQGQSAVDSSALTAFTSTSPLIPRSTRTNSGVGSPRASTVSSNPQYVD